MSSMYVLLVARAALCLELAIISLTKVADLIYTCYSVRNNGFVALLGSSVRAEIKSVFLSYFTAGNCFCAMV